MIEKITSNKLTWLDITNPTREDLAFLSEKYKFHDLDLEDCLSKVQRPKIEDYEEYTFLVLHFPVMQPRGYRLSIEEVDIFWGDDYVITLHSRNFSKISEIFDNVEKNKDLLKKYFSDDSDYLLYEVLHEVALSIFPIMNRISKEIDVLDNSFDTLKPLKLIERISALRRNIIFLQTSFKPNKNIFAILENQFEAQEEKGMDVYWGDIGDYIGKLMDMAEDYQELIDGLYSSIDTLLTYRTNSIIKTLTIFSVIMLPLTFITGFYGMNIRLPFQEEFAHSYESVLVVSGIMALIAIGMLIYFKIKRF